MIEFNFDDFRKEKYERRTKELELKNFGASQDTLIWHIQNLDAVDFASIRLAVEKNQELRKAQSTNATQEVIALLSEFLGFDKSVPDSLIRQYVMFEIGSIEPNKPKNRPDTVKFASVYPVEFTKIVNEIDALSCMGGQVKKKQSDSGMTQK